jgi:hypothetical protein
MRTSFIVIFALLIVGCESSQRSAPLTAAQAETLAMRLANDKADKLFHHRPFQDSQPAHFAAGRWIWTDSHGVGLEDFQARVELAADGSTNSVDIKLLDDVLRSTIRIQER